MNCHANGAVLRMGAHGDNAARRGIANGVIDEVGEGLLQPLLVSLQGGQRRDVKAHGSARFSQPPVEPACADPEQVAEVDRFVLHHGLPRLQPGEIDQVLHQAVHALRLLVDDAARLLELFR